MATNFRIIWNRSQLNAAGMRAAEVHVTDTTRRVLNRAIVLTPVDTGRLRAANQMRVGPRGALAFVGEVFNPTSYAPPVHDGSKAYIVRPRRKKALRFVVGGQVVFAAYARIPARRGRPWLYRALREVAIPRGYKVTAG